MLYSERFNIKNATASQIYDKIDLKYYDAEIEDIKKRISNIRLKKVEYIGYGRHYSQTPLTEKEAERRIKDLEKQLKAIQKKRKKMADVVSLAHHTEYEIGRVAKRDALHDLFHDVLRDIERPYNREAKEYEDSKFVEKHGKTIIKARRKDARKLSKENHKVDRKLYFALKRNAKKMNLLINNNGLSLDYVIKESKYSLSGLLWSLYDEKSRKYRKDLFSLGVDRKKIERAKELIKEKCNEGSHDFCVSSCKTKYNALLQIKERETYAPINDKVNKFLVIYEDILVRGKELLALKCLLEAFKNTEYKESESYLNVERISSKIKEDIEKMVDKADKEYEKANLPVLIENYKKLESLYSEYLICLANHRNSKDAEYSWSEHIGKANEYRAEMIAILFKYPELNRPEYHIDLDRKKKNAIEEARTEPYVAQYVEPDTEPVFDNGYQGARVHEVSSEPVVKTDYEIKVDRRRTSEVDSEPAKGVFVPPTERKVDEKTEDERLKESIEVPSYLSGLITVYYPQYVRFKALNPDHADLAFSEYLEYVRPDLKELIEIERKKEQRVETIFKKYIKYRAALANKERAMSFRSYAKLYYNVENYDIPQEYDERVKAL